MLDHRDGADLRRCLTCARSFTATAWKAHEHNPDRVRCDVCANNTIGGRAHASAVCVTEAKSVCGPHGAVCVRDGHRVQFVDGGLCTVCGGQGTALVRWTDPEKPGGTLASCPTCQGTGYDPTAGERPLARQQPSLSPAPTPLASRIEAELRKRLCPQCGSALFTRGLGSEGHWAGHRIVPVQCALCGRIMGYGFTSALPDFDPAGVPLPVGTTPMATGGAMARVGKYAHERVPAWHGVPRWPLMASAALLLIAAGAGAALAVQRLTPLREPAAPFETPEGPPVATNPPPAGTAVTPAPTASPALVMTPTAARTPTPVVRTSNPTAVPRDRTPAELREHVLDLVNRDRAAFGVSPVALGTNQAAQQHADDMFANYYLAHWDTQGHKPYMLYTLAGGEGYVAENAAYTGPMDPDDRRRYVEIQPAKDVAELERLMMYDDADSDWGHRDNILRPWHQLLNIGVAVDSRRLAFVQHFEHRRVTWSQVPRHSGTRLTLSGTLDLDVGPLAQVVVYYEPKPAPQTAAQLNAGPHSYGVGEGLPVVVVLPPPGPGYRYTNLDPYDLVADIWQAEGPTFSVMASVGPWWATPGVYTVVLWGERAEYPLTSYSIFLN